MIKVLLSDGRLVSIRGSEEKHLHALWILWKVAPEDDLSAMDAEGNRIEIRAGDIQQIFDASGRPYLKKSETLNTIRGEIKE